MDLNKLQKKIDNSISVLSDHDDKKHEERYINLQKTIEEAQDYIEKGNHSTELNLEFYNELKKCIKEFEEDRLLFIIFLIILCGLLFVGVFYITYSHFYEHFYDGGVIQPAVTTTQSSTTTSDITTDSTSTTDKTTSSTSKHTSSTTTTTTKVADETTSTTDKTTVTTKTTTSSTTKSTTDSTSKTTSTTSSTTSSTTKPIIVPDPGDAFVTVIFDNSSLIDLDNIYPVDDNVGINTKPTTWKLDSTLSSGSKDYIITYTINFVDKIDDIPVAQRLDVSNLKYLLLIKKNGTEVYNSGVQDLYDYPEAEDGVRPIITGQSYNNDETLDFELRMWLDSSVGNTEQGKKYRFTIDVEAGYEFIE